MGLNSDHLLTAPGGKRPQARASTALAVLPRPAADAAGDAHGLSEAAVLEDGALLNTGVQEV